MEFKIAIEKDEDGWYIVTLPALPGCVSQGKTEEEAKKNIAEVIDFTSGPSHGTVFPFITARV